MSNVPSRSMPRKRILVTLANLLRILITLDIGLPHDFDYVTPAYCVTPLQKRIILAVA